MGMFVLIIPFLTVLLFLTSNTKWVLHTINATCAVLLLAVSILITRSVITLGNISYPLWNSFFYIDSLSIIVLDIIMIVSSMVCIYSIGYLNEEYKHNIIDIKRMKIFYMLTYAFIFTMVLVVTTRNIGLMWIAIEATTLASAFLVGFYNNKNSLEAAWKYIIICSVGISLALLGIVFLNYSSGNVFHDPGLQLNWTALYQNASKLDGGILKISFIFILVGFGTKVGLVPMHTWLPDAHSQAPSPISAMLSGVLLNSALYGIIRIIAVVNKNLGSSVYTGRLMIAFGLLSIATAAVFIIPQRDYKRLLAYSSIEHMGIIALGIGIFTPAAIFGALFHMINHAFTKSMLFLASGNVYLKYNTRDTSKVTGLLKTMPYASTAFLLGLFAIAGVPPFSIFSSELSIIVSSFDANHPVLGAVFIILVAIVFAGIASAMLKMFFGDNKNKDIKKGEVNIPGIAVIIVLLIIISVTGVYMPAKLALLIESASKIIMGV